MTNESPVIALQNISRYELKQITTVKDGLTYLNKLKALEVWVRDEKHDAKAQNIVAEQKIRTQRRIGEILREREKINGSRGIGKKVESLDSIPLLSDVGLSLNQSSIFQKIAAMPEPEFEKGIAEKKESAELTTAGMLRLAKGAHVSNNSGDNEWYTPEKYIHSARKVMGRIDLDPASTKRANEIIKAETYFDEEADGLTQKWFGCIWLNPPYAQPLINDFIDKLETESFEQAIALVNNATETKWGQKLLRLSSVVCFHTGRVRFIDPDGVMGDAPLQGQIIVYIGNERKKFADEFSQYGICLNRVL